MGIRHHILMRFAFWVVVLTGALGVSVGQAETPNAVPLAEINGEAVTAEDLDQALGVKLTKLQEQLYALKRVELDVQIGQRLLAQEANKRGVSVAALLDAEVTAKVGLVTETEIGEKKRGQATLFSAGGRDGAGWIRVPGRWRVAVAT
jgi:hypothetical protein